MDKTAKGRQLKVYWARIDGLNEWIVAAPNRPAALEAFGMRQDLFAHGAAGEETAPDKVAAAQGQPGVPLLRSKGSTSPFTPYSGVSDWSAAAPKARKARPKKADRKALDQAEARLKQVEDEHRQALADIEQERARIDERQARESRLYEAARLQAQGEREDAAEAFGKAQGR